MKPIFFTAFFLMLANTGLAQSDFQNTIRFDEKKGSPKAKITDMSWISGHWRGEAFGGITEEVWTPPIGESMMCVFKLVVNGNVQFYEFVTISKEEGTLIMRLKHFDAKLVGWEDKDKSIDFELVKITSNKIYFDEFTFEKVNDNEINIYVVIENSGKKEEVKFNYKRVE